MKHLKTLILGALLAAGLAGCESIGEGNTVQRLEIIHAGGATPTPPFKLYECVRDQLVVVAVFNDGTRADFSFRADWSSTDPTKVQVSNGDLPMHLINDDHFEASTSLFYRPGTLVPAEAASPGDQVTVTARFAGLRATMLVEVAAPAFSITAAPVEPVSGGTILLGEGTTRSLRLMATLGDQVVQASSLNALDVINPVLWRFVGGVSVPRDADYSGDADKIVLPDGTDPELAISSFNGLGSSVGLVTGYEPGTGTAEAMLSLCPADAAAAGDGSENDTEVTPATNPAYLPTAAVEVVPFATTGALTVDYEDDFDADFIVGTFEQLQMQGELDTTGDGVGDGVFQDLSTLARAVITPFNGCEDFSTSVCALNQSLTMSLGSRNQVQAVTNPVTVGGVDDNADPLADDPYDADAIACFPDVSPLATLSIGTAAAGPGQVEVAANATVTLTASAVYPPMTGDVPRIVSYVISFNDGTVTTYVPADPIANQSVCDTSTDTSCTMTHSYATGGRGYRPTVSVVDECGRVSANVGAALVGVDLLDDADGIENPPSDGSLDFVAQSPFAPASVAFGIDGISDPDSDVIVFEFDPADGSGNIVRQIGTSLAYRYGAAPATEPMVRAVDVRGLPSSWVTTSADGDEALDDAIIKNDVTLRHFITSTAIPLNAVEAELTSLEVCTEANPVTVVPPCDGDATEVVFTFPGVQFEAVGTFTAVVDADNPNNLFIGSASTKRYKVTRLVTWRANATGTEDLSEYVTIQNSNDGLLKDGQARYLQYPPDAGATVDVLTELGTTLAGLLPDGVTVDAFETSSATPGTLTVTCPGGDCP